MVIAAITVGVALAAAVTLGRARFRRRVDAEFAAMAAGSPEPAELVRAEALAGLPAPVRRWLEGAGVVGRERARTVLVLQRGRLHTAREARWMPVVAEQHFAVDDPAFVWRMDARMLGFVPLCGRDRYVGGAGEMLVTVAGLVDLVRERGPKIDHGAMLRFLAEIMWFPSAALRPYLRWEGLDDDRARATMTHRGVTASAVFTFDEGGRPTAVTALRYYGASGRLERWGGRNTRWRVVRGVEIPVRGEVVWTLADGEFVFFRWEIDDVETNRPARRWWP